MRGFAVLFLVGLVGCASIPRTRYGVAELDIEGTETMGEESIRACLSTAARGRFNFRLGASSPSCGAPPFDTDAPRLQLWAWPWTEWPLFDRVAFEQDLRRIERWYAARGYHQARVVDTEVRPAEAGENDTLPDENPPCEREGNDEGCEVELTVRVEEGEPTVVAEVVLHDVSDLPPDLQARVRDAVVLVEGERFDEWLYDESRSGIASALYKEGYAHAEVIGEVRVDRPNRRARIDLRVSQGPLCRFGEVTVGGNADLDEELIRSAARIPVGEIFDPSTLEEAQRAVYSLGAFSAVVVERADGDREQNRGEADSGESDSGDADPAEVDQTRAPEIPIRVQVTPARRFRFGLGFGIQSGILTKGSFSTEQVSVPQWDGHLLLRATHRNFLGHLRQLEVEDRPRLIFQDIFPQVTRPRFGNVLTVDLRQPGTFEARTVAKISLGYELGPDPFDIFFRHRIDSGIGIERPFFFAPLTLELGLRNSIYLVPNDESTLSGEPLPTDSVLTFLEQTVRLDYRDDSQRPHAGFFAQLTVHEAGYFLPSSWNYIRVLPDVRGYIPLPAGITLAMRFALGMYFIDRADDGLDELSQTLGPRDYRLRGGGGASNRGFLPGRLGDGLEGGTRRWEASVELRVPINNSLGVVAFADAGDVSRAPRFRFDHPQLSVGGGIRLYTVIGAIRLDIAGRVSRAQVFGEEERLQEARATRSEVSFFVRFPGAVHITIGEAF
ncbi:MAG: POTRA domain-containing protein [Myxococcota bacterium]